jgi:hypothetical protein
MCKESRSSLEEACHGQFKTLCARIVGTIWKKLAMANLKHYVKGE